MKITDKDKEKNKEIIIPSKLPFGKAVEKEQLLSYSQLEELKMLLRMAIEQRSMGLVTGQAGTGKTTGVKIVTDELPTNKYSVVYLGQDQDRNNICRRLACGLGLEPKRSSSHTLLSISQYLADNRLEQGRDVVLVIDEAHLLDNSTLEDIRLLTNSHFDTFSPLTIILIGQLPLRSRLKGVGFEALNQRLRFRFSLEGFSEQETDAYIRHHLRLVNIPEDFFEPQAIKQIFLASRGVLREINNLALMAFLKAIHNGLSKVDAKLVRLVLDQRELN